MRKLYLLALSLCFPLGASGHDEESLTSLHISSHLVRMWQEPYEGPERVVEVPTGKRERHFKLSMSPSRSGLQPSTPEMTAAVDEVCDDLPPTNLAPQTLPDNGTESAPTKDMTCHFTPNYSYLMPYLSALSYKDPHTGHTLFLTPF